jgi:hypothetical protein
MPVKGGYLIVAGGGAILLWSGIRGHKWSSVLRDVISGKPIPQTTELAISTSPAAMQGSVGGTAGAATSAGNIGGSAAKNRAIGKVLAVRYGWSTGAQWAALDRLWGVQESGWNNKAKNPASGAYGIAQALPASKYGPLGNPPISSATVQILWGLKYIKDTYGNPVNAEAHELANNWY